MIAVFISSARDSNTTRENMTSRLAWPTALQGGPQKYADSIMQNVPGLSVQFMSLFWYFIYAHNFSTEQQART